jgi:hypothetical protein
MKQKVYSLIEEYSEDADDMTEDEDLALKMNSVINQIQNELARFKKIPRDTTLEVSEGQEIALNDIDKDIYQLGVIRGVDYDTMNDKVIFNEDGEAKIYYYKYPKQITSETPDSYKFELSTDVLEIMPYGVAADLLKSDVSSQYGTIYEARYRELKNALDPRYGTSAVEITGGFKV